MSKVAISIPQLGEGLQEARLIRFLKKPGDSVKRDEPLYEMETDKAVSEVESPFTGVIAQWLVEEDSVLAIGSEIGFMEIDGGDASTAAGASDAAAQKPEAATESVPVSPADSLSDSHTEVQSAQVVPSAQTSTTGGSTAKSLVMAGKVPVPPRTRRYLREKNLQDVADQIPAAGKRLTEEDVDRYLATISGKGAAATSGEAGSSPTATKDAPPVVKTVADANDPYQESTLPQSQQTLNYRMARGAQVVIPAVLETDLDWRQIQNCRELTRPTGGPTGFAMVLWCIVKAMGNHPALRSSLSGDGKTLRTYSHVNLGIAVSLPGDELKTAVVRHADALSQSAFFETLADRIAAARNGQDQIDGTTTVSVSNIGASQMRAGVPVVVAPAVATMAIGEVRPQAVVEGDAFAFRPFAALTMTFDHRLVNGVGAANFLTEVRRRVSEFSLETM